MSTPSPTPFPPSGTGPVLLRGATVISVDPSIGVLERGDVLIDGPVIRAVGPDLLEQAGPGVENVEATGMIALPGFVDSHLHAWEGLLRGFAATADFGTYLGLTAFGFGPRYAPTDVYAGTFASVLAALNAGITTVVDNAHNALTRDHAAAGIEALLDAGIRGVHAVGSPFGAELDHVPATALALRDRYTGPLLDVRLFEVNPTLELWTFAKAHELWVSTELGPHTPGPAERFEALAQAGLLGPQHAFNHCYDLPDTVWKAIGDSGTSVNLCPRSDATFGLGSTVPPVRPALQHAAAVGLSNDNEISYAINLFAEMQTLLLRDRGEEFRRRAASEDARRDDLTAEQVLTMATLGGAANAGLSHSVGSLTPGKQADIVLLRVDELSTLTHADPVTTATTMAHPGMVDTVFVAGQLRKWRGTLVGVDAEATRVLVTSSRERLRTG